ncbi:MAG: outer membrane lipoprotein chaperone LolA [Duodenibacillus sp.]|nr:outer membrane lipoprotein chaperone LolA [Duodenibacillus sp.]HBC69679.1 outer membrane lipoprotein carrier protein LolA [Sutterella sp.]
MRRRSLIALALACAAVPDVFAAPSGRAFLERFAREAGSAKGRFTQLLLDKSGNPREPESSGEFSFRRPGKFSWIVTAPYRQSVVANGRTLWLYDPDLMQVTVKRLAGTMSATPASVLFGSGDLSATFVLEDQPERDGLVWVKATPKTQDPSFACILIGFSSGGRLVRLELIDHFSQKTTLAFRELELNASIPDETFEFAPPKGVDVLEDNLS